MLFFSLIKWTHTTKFNKKIYQLMEKVCELVNKQLQVKENLFFDVIIVSLKQIQKINAKFRKINQPTDVLTFVLKDANDIESPLLGEIYLCPKYIKKCANDLQKNFVDEFIFTFIHGIYHLFGYTHNTKTNAKKMFQLQDEIMEQMFND